MKEGVQMSNFEIRIIDAHGSGNHSSILIEEVKSKKITALA